MTLQPAAESPPTMKIQIPITKDTTILGELRYVPLSELKLDPKNVRFKHLDRTLNDKEIEEWISTEADTRSLMKEIRFSIGLSEKPYVQETSDGKYRVVEGNRRTVCLRKIAETIKSGKEKEIPASAIDPVQCIVIPKEVNEKSLAIFLARIHVSGKKDWNALNQSAHVFELIRKHEYEYDDVAQAVSISKTKVTLMIKAYEATLKYREKYHDDDMWLHRYSHFEELFKKKGLKEWANEPLNLDLFMKWVYENQFPMAIHVRKLEPIILDGKDAYKALKKGAIIDEAAEILKQQDQKRSLTSKMADNVDDTVKGFQELVENFPRGKMKELAKDGEKLQNYESLYKEFGRLIKDIKNFGGN